MICRSRVAFLFSAILALPSYAQGEETEAPESQSAPASTVDAAPESDATTTEGESEGTSDAAAAVAGGMVGMQGGGGDAFPLHIQGSFSHFVGQGTFVQGYADNPQVASSLWLNPLAFWGGLRWGLTQNFDFEWTDSDSTTTNHQVVLSDLGMQVVYPGLRFADLGTTVILSGNATLPFSMASRQQGRLSAFSGGARAIWSGPWGLNVNGGGSLNYNLHIPSFASRGAVNEGRPYSDRSLGEVIPSSCIRRNADELGNYACSFIPSVGGYNLRGGIGWAGFDGQLSLSASLSLQQQFSAYLGPDDEFTPDNTQTGLQARDITTSGVLTATYIPTSWLFLSIGTQNFQPLLNTKRDGLRPFPFWDFSGPANNLSSIFIDASFFY
ncbi:MAG: hypothetical protein ACO3JL_02400 [Myxococcota bacterium]